MDDAAELLAQKVFLIDAMAKKLVSDGWACVYARMDKDAERQLNVHGLSKHLSSTETSLHRHVVRLRRELLDLDRMLTEKDG